jgi:hypothetical protein
VSVGRFRDGLSAVHGFLCHTNVSIPDSYYIVCLLFITVNIVLGRFSTVLRARREIVLR